MAPSPAGEGWGEENKINYLHFTYLISTFFLKGEGAGTCVDTYARWRGFYLALSTEVSICWYRNSCSN